MRIALTGVSGFIGSFIARHLHAAGHRVTGLVRETSRRDHIEPFVDRFVVGEQDDERAWSELLDGANCVIHNSLDWQSIKLDKFDHHLRSNLLGSIRLLKEAADRGIGQFIFMSTVAVHHDIRPRWNGEVDEDHPLRPGSVYGAYKAAVEPHLWWAHYGLGMNTSAFRPCAVYGIDPKLGRSIGSPIIEQLQRGERIERTGGGKFVHVEDVAEAVTKAVGNETVAGRAFNLADMYLRWADWAAIAAEELGIDAEIDFSSPDQPKNIFTKDAANEIGIKLDRGREGVRQHLRELIRAMAETPAKA